MNGCIAYCGTHYEISPDKEHKIVWECKGNPLDSNVYSRKCNVYALDARGKTKWIHQKADLPEPTVTWHNNSLAKITIPCGSPCNYSIFYDVKEGVSEPFEFVIAVNAEKKVVARAGSSIILINNIFYNSEKIIMKIDRNFGETAALVLVIEEAHFTKSGNLFIRYLSGKNYVPKEEIIPVKYQNLK